MKRLLVLVWVGLITAGCATAQVPPSDVIESCLQARATTKAVTVTPMPNNEVYRQDDYADGFNATYYFTFQGQDVGYAERGDEHALIVAGKLEPLSKARRMPGATSSPPHFNPHLADWLFLSARGRDYICASFNFDGIGRSGSFQRVRGAYVISGERAGSALSLWYEQGVMPNGH